MLMNSAMLASSQSLAIQEGPGLLSRFPGKAGPHACIARLPRTRGNGLEIGEYGLQPSQFLGFEATRGNERPEFLDNLV